MKMSEPAVKNKYYETRTEKHNGRIVMMASGTPVHHRIKGRLHLILGGYLIKKPCEVFVDGPDVILSENDEFVPDIAVVCNKDIIKEDDAIYGAPDLIVEVLSPSTSKRDRGYKKEIYGKYGVREYWLVDTTNRTIEIYTQKDGKLEFYNMYTLFNELELKKMTDEEKTDIVTKFNPVIFPELIINLEDVFGNI